MGFSGCPPHGPNSRFEKEQKRPLALLPTLAVKSPRVVSRSLPGSRSRRVDASRCA
jgi:hypothetical protein